MKVNYFLLVLSIIIGSFFLSGCNSEKRDWGKTQSTNTIEGYNDFLKKYPANSHISEITQIIDTLEWNKVKSLNSIQGYQKFLESNLKSNFRKEAQESLDWLLTIKSDSLEKYKCFVDKYPNSQSISIAQKYIEENRPIVNIDDEYKLLAVKYAKEVYFEGLSDEKAFIDAKKTNMHFEYLSFLEIYPKSKHIEEVKSYLNNFAEVYLQKSTIPFTILSKEYNFDGNHDYSRWNMSSVLMIVGKGLSATNGFCYGNIQIMKNDGISFSDKGMTLSAKTRIIYPINGKKK